MPSYKTPGVYVEEVSSGSKPIASVGTSTAGFIGLARKGQTNKAIMITNWTQFVKEFGNCHKDYYLPITVYHFFAEGGSKCYVVRVLPETAKKAVVILKDDAGADFLQISAASEGEWGNNLTLEVTAPKNPDKGDFNISLIEKGERETVVLEQHIDVKTADLDLDFESSNMQFAAIGDETGKPAEGTFAFTGGSTADRLDSIKYLDKDDAMYLGTEANKLGLHALDVIDEVNIIAIPDQAGDPEVMKLGVNYCFQRFDCFFVADPPKMATIEEVTEFGRGISAPKGFGALYYPWVKVMDPDSGQPIDIPPSGLVTGTYALTDSTRGVHKAPAGTSEGFLNTALRVEKVLNNTEQESLNDMGVNVIRHFAKDGICIWGCRCTTNDAEWKYINIRRLFLMVEESLEEALTWVVFEPNDPKLWGSVKRNVTAFLTNIWRTGALFGGSPEEAFYVKIDGENNPQSLIDLGQLNIEVGMAPVKPAEFVILKISQKTA